MANDNRDWTREMREAYENRHMDILRIRNLGTKKEPYPEILARERSTGELLTVTPDKIER